MIEGMTRAGLLLVIASIVGCADPNMGTPPSQALPILHTFDADAAARLAKDCITKVEVLDYPDLGMEAVWKIDVVDFPAFIVVDDKGNDFFADLTGVEGPKPSTPVRKLDLL